MRPIKGLVNSFVLNMARGYHCTTLVHREERKKIKQRRTITYSRLFDSFSNVAMAGAVAIDQRLSAEIGSR
jgi:hypothetical protein